MVYMNINTYLLVQIVGGALATRSDQRQSFWYLCNCNHQGILLLKSERDPYIGA